MTTLGGEPCRERDNDGQRCTKNDRHLSPHRFPMGRGSGRTLAQAIGQAATCLARRESKDAFGTVKTHRCRKPLGHHSNHHDGGRTWA